MTSLRPLLRHTFTATDRRDRPVDEVKISAASCRVLDANERYVEEFEPSSEH